MWLIVGLGNPGNRYQTTRHNVGFLVLDLLASRHEILWRERKPLGCVGKGVVSGEEAQLVKPLSFMNRSGMVVGLLAIDAGIPPERIIVVHDDMDISFDRLKIKRGGGAGGHKGVGSIVECLDSDGFFRVKMGIGRPDPRQRPEDFVLGHFSEEQMETLPGFLEQGAAALEAIIEEGVERAMNRFNRRLAEDREEAGDEKPASEDGG